MHIPNHIFKFRKIDKRSIESLITGDVYFSKPDDFNDPFDCQLDLFKSLDRAILLAEQSTQTILLEIKKYFDLNLPAINSDIKEFGVFCGSQSLINELMWAHYADSHKGICFTYGLPEVFLDPSKGVVLGTHPVDYLKEPLVNWFLSIEDRLGAYRDFNNLVTDMAIVILTSKAPCWAYENEGRVISQTSGLKNIGSESLKQVCFGLKTPQKDKDLIYRILSGVGYKGIYCEIEKDETDFGMREKEIKF
jgi:hypothetical protein